MRHVIGLAFYLAFIFTIASPALFGQELKSGPQTGEFLPGPFHVLNLNGPHASNPHCLVCEYGLGPVVIVFTRDVSKVAGLLQKLDEAVASHQRAGLKSFAVFLSDNFAKEGNQKTLVQSLDKTAGELKNVVLAVTGPAGPEKYNINKDAEVTVILYKQLKVVGNFAFAKDKLTDKEIGEIMAATEKLAAGR
jgi:hypothetical protein